MISFLFLQVCYAQKVDSLVGRNSPEATIVGFLKWYNVNQDRLSSAGSAVDGGDPDTTTFYKINFTKVDSYLNKFKRSGFVSDSYIKEFKQMFVSINDSLVKYPQNQGPIIGLNLDVVLKTFDDRDILDHIDEGRFESVIVESNKASVKFTIEPSVKMLFTLLKKGDKWLIENFNYYN